MLDDLALQLRNPPFGPALLAVARKRIARPLAYLTPPAVQHVRIHFQCPCYFDPRSSRCIAAFQRKAALPPATMASTPGRRIGKPVQFWLHEEDRKIIRELAAWLAGQGIRPTDSMVVRAALRMSKPGGLFLDAYRNAALLDGRLRATRSAKPAE